MIAGLVTASIGYLATAGSQIIDKLLLARTFRHPVSFAFWGGILGLGVFILLPFDFMVPKPSQWPVIILSGFIFQLGLLIYYQVASQEEISKASMVIGATTPLVTLIIARLFLAEQLLADQLWGVVVAVTGTIFIAHSPVATSHSTGLLVLSIISAVCFAIASVSLKAVFEMIAFVPGLVWTRLGGILLALILFLSKGARQYILAKAEQPRGGRAWLFLFGQGLGAVGFLLINWAIFVSSPTIVNALQGVRHAAIFGLALLFSHWWPKIFREPQTPQVIAMKVVGLLMVGLGIILMA